MINERDIVLTADDVAPGGACFLGARAWANTHGFDFRQWLKGNGPTVGQVLDTGCPIAAKICAAAIKRVAAKGNE